MLWPSDNKDDVVDRDNAHVVKEEDSSKYIEKKRRVKKKKEKKKRRKRMPTKTLRKRREYKRTKKRKKKEDASLDIEKKRGVSPVNPETEGQLLESVSTPTPSGYK